MKPKDEFDQVLEMIETEKTLLAYWSTLGDNVWCDDCQDWFPRDEEGNAECNCVRDYDKECVKELDFND